MAVNKFITSQYPSFVIDAFNQYQPQFLQSLLNKQPLIPNTQGEQNVIQQGRDFTANPLTNPLFSAYSQAQTNLMAPSEDIARRNLTDAYRRAGAGTLQSGAFAEGASNLERDLATNRGDLITKGYAQLYPAIGNQLNNQASLEALPRTQQEKTLSFLQSLLGAHNQGTGFYEQNTTGENVAQFLSPLLAAVLGGGAGTTGGAIGSGILGLLKSGALKISDLLGLSGNDASNLDNLLQDLPESGLGNLLPDALSSGLGNYGNFDFSSLSPGGDWSFANDFGNTGNWGFDFSNFSDALAGQGATAGADFGSALDNFQPFDLPYPNPADMGALAETMSGTAPLGDLGSFGGGLGGSLAMAGLSAALNALGAPPVAQSVAGVLGGALLGANPLTLPFAFLGPILSGSAKPSNADYPEEARVFQEKVSSIRQQVQSNQPVQASDLQYVGFNSPQNLRVSIPTALAAQVLSAQEQGGQLEQVPGGYMFRNVTVQPVDIGMPGQPSANSRGTGGNGKPLGNPITIPQIFISQDDVNRIKGDLAGYRTGRYDTLSEDSSGAWEPGSLDMTWPDWIPKTAERLALEGLDLNTGFNFDYRNVNDRRE